MLREKLLETMKKRLGCATKSGKKLKTSQTRNVSLINICKGWGWNIFVVKYLLFSVINYLSFILFLFFSLFFVCVCVTNFCGSFVILFWCYLIKKEINITKKKKNNKKQKPFQLVTVQVIINFFV